MSGFDFIRTLTVAEIESGALALADDDGRKFADALPEGTTSLFIFSETGSPAIANLRGQQLAGPNLAAWYERHDLDAGSILRVHWQEGDMQFGKPIITLAVADEAALQAYRAANTATTSAARQPKPVADEPPGTARADLETLEDWEVWLSRQMRQVTLIGEIDITEDDFRALGRLLKTRLKGRTRAQCDRLLRNEFSASFIAYLVAGGVYGYNFNNYWTPVRQHTGVNEQKSAHWGEIFEEGLYRFGLPRFQEIEGGLRFVTVILMHGGIPRYSLDDFFQKVLRHAVTRIEYMDRPTDEVIDLLLDRSQTQFSTDRPVQRFLEFGGKVALDFFERSREMFRGYVETGEMASAQELGLPKHVVETFAEWADEQGEIDTTLTVRDRLRLRKPRVVLEPSGDGVSLILPRQEIPATLAQADFAWEVRGVEPDRPAHIPLQLRKIGYDLRLEERVLPLDGPRDLLEIHFHAGESTRRWALPVLSSEAPLVAFDPERRELIPWRHSLPADTLWLLYPKTASLDFDGEARMVWEFDDQPDGWFEFHGGEWDLSDAQRLTLVAADGAQFAIPIRASERRTRPMLVRGETLLHDADRGDSPLYVGAPPQLRVPLTTEQSPDEESRRWRITLESQGPAAPAVEQRFVLNTNDPAVTLDGNTLLLSLAADALLGPTARGHYRLRARGPLGKDAEFSFRAWPVVGVQGMRDLYLPGETGPERVPFWVEVSPGDALAAQAGVEDMPVAQEGVDPTHWQVVAPPDVRIAELVLTHTAAAGGAVQVPLRLRIPRLRWSLPEYRAGVLEKVWSARVLRQSINALLEADRPPEMMVDLPYAGDRTPRLQLALRDANDHVVQLGRIHEPARPSRFWRLPLGEFLDTLRQSQESILRLEVLIGGLSANVRWQRVHALTLTRQIEVNAVALESLDASADGAWQFHWDLERGLKNLHARLWPAWRPWGAPLQVGLGAEPSGVAPIPDSSRLHPGRYLVEFFIADPWVASSTQMERPLEGAPDIAVADTVQPDEYLRALDRRKSADPYDYDIRFERACVLTSVGGSAESAEELQWCYENSDFAPFERVLTLRRWLAASGDETRRKALELRMFGPQRVRRLLDAHRAGEVADAVLREYLAAAPAPTLMPRETARHLLTVADERVVINAVHTLVERGEAAGVAKIVELVRGRRLADVDAAGLLALNGDLAVRELQEMAHDEDAVRLLDGLASELGDAVPIVRPGTWVNCGVGWGRIVRITDPTDGTEIDQFVRGRQIAILDVQLRAGEPEAEPVSVDLGRSKVTFVDADKVFTCPGCGKFSSRDQQLCVDNRHRRAAHMTGLAGSRPEPSNVRRTAEKIAYRRRRPPSIWE